MRDVTERGYAEHLDATEPLAGLRERFVVSDPDLIYLDGNSLGRLPLATRERIRDVVDVEWGTGLVGSWSEWVREPQRVGDLIASGLLGAGRGEVVVTDSTSVNLYKLAAAALDARPGRTTIVTDTTNFPSDRYVLEGLAAARGMNLRTVTPQRDSATQVADLDGTLGDDVALVSLSHVDYRSGAVADMAAITARTHEVGALSLWDLCHSVGALPVALGDCGVDLAVGCTYKYLNAGPGAPAFLFVRHELQAQLRQPIWGWFGQRGQFEMGPTYDPAPGISRYLVGTPPIVGVAAVEAGVETLLAAGIDALRAKGVALGELAIALADEWLSPLGFSVASPRDSACRGSHVALRHPRAWQVTQVLIERCRVVPDFREPDIVRLGLAPAYTRFVDVWDALERCRRAVAAGEHERFPKERGRVT